MQQLPLDLIRPPAPSFDNFVTGPNAEAIDVARRIVNGQSPARVVFLCGPAGCGKSHLLDAVANSPGSATFGEHPSASESTPYGLVWVADDIGHLSAARHQDLFNLINRLRSESSSCVLAAHRERPALLGIRDDLRTRLASGLVIGLDLLSDDQKADALRQHSQARGLTAGPGVINWLLTHQDRDIRHLMAFLDCVDRYALATRRQLTVALLREFERKHRPGPATDKII